MSPVTHHPAVDVFIHSDSIVADAIKKAQSDDVASRLIRKMGYTFKSQSSDSHEAIMRAAEAAYQDIPDPLFAALFSRVWMSFACAAGRLDDARRILNRAKALLEGRTCVEIEAETLAGESSFLINGFGNWMRAIDLLRRAYDMLSPESPRRSVIFSQLCLDLALVGRLSEVEGEFDAVFEKANELIRKSMTSARCTQAMETGRVEDAARILAQTPDCYGALYRASRAPEYRLLLQLLGGRWAPRSAVTAHGTNADPAGTELPNWAVVIDSLLRRRPDSALTAIQPDVEEGAEHFLIGARFRAFNLVRVKLSLGDGVGGRRIIDMRRRRGNCHYLDDFFLARAALLVGERDVAARHFTALQPALERYQAQGRLDFELRLACELEPGDLLAMGHAAAAASRAPAPSMPATTDAASGLPGLIGAGRLLGRSAVIATVRDQIDRYARLDAPVLVTGETGTGKELVARAIHEAGPRRGEPFVAVNCGSVAETLLESEFFGHDRGAFTGAVRAHRGIFEETGRGTVLLDEIGDIPQRLQVALLRVLEAGEIRPVGSSRTKRIFCRIVAATNADLAALEAAGGFRRDLLYRLRRLQIHLPPLRERREDILPLADHFLAEGMPSGVRAVMTEDLRQALLAHRWPGNVRELRNTVERMRILNPGPRQHYDVRAFRVGVPGSEMVAAEEEPCPAQTGLTAKAPAEGLVAGRVEGDLDLLRNGRSQRRRIERLRQLFRQQRELSHGEVRKITSSAPTTVTRDLKALVDEGFLVRIEPTRSKRSRYYRLRGAAGEGKPAT